MVALTESRTLSNGVEIPVLGLGTFLASDPKLLKQALKHAVDKVGYRHIDTAALYKNEGFIGESLKELEVPREQLFITSKLQTTDIVSKESAIKAFQTSIDYLGTTYLDNYLIHWPFAHVDPETSRKRLIEAWKGLEELYESGKCKSIGVSNFTVRDLEWFLPHVKIVPHINQVEAHIYLDQHELAAYCRERKIQLVAYRTLGAGGVLDDPVLVRVADKLGKTPAQVALKWALQNDFVVIPKSVTPERIESNAQLFDFEIDVEDLKALNALNKDLHYCPNPNSWEELSRVFGNAYAK